MTIEWTYDKPKVQGWYWVTYCGYELPEVIFLSKDGLIYSAGSKENTQDIQINKWAKQPLEMPEL